MASSIDGATDGELLAIALTVIDAITASPTSYGVPITLAADLTTARTDMESAVNTQASAVATARSATAAKVEKRDIVEEQIRTVRRLAKAHGTSDTDMASLGIPSSTTSAPTTVTRPIASADTSQRLQHTIHWTDQATPDNKKKPRGQMGAEIWMKLDGPPPSDETDCVFLTLDAFTPYLNTFDGADAGKMAHYILRWRGRDGSVGPFSETVSATVAG